MSGSSLTGDAVGLSTTGVQPAEERDRPQTKAFAPLSLRHNFSWTLIGTIVYAATQFAILSVLAHLTGSAVVGLFALGLAITEPIFLFSNLSLRTVQATDARHLFRFSDYLGFRLGTTALAVSAAVVIAFTAGHRGEAFIAIVAIGLVKAIESLSDVGYGLLQQRERMDRIAVSMMLKGICGLALFAGVLALTGSLLPALVALVAARATIVAFYDVRQVSHAVRQEPEAGVPIPSNWLTALRPSWNNLSLMALGRLALPLGIVQLLVSLGTNIPRLSLADSAGASALGIYATMVYFIFVGDTLAAALSQATVPRLAALYAAGDLPAFRRLVVRLLLIGAAIGLAGIVGAALVGKPVLQLLYGPEFAAHSDVLVLVMLVGAVLIIGNYLGTAITAMRQFTAQVWVHLVEVAALVGASGFLIQRYGLQGAAWAALLGALVVAVGFSGVLIKEFRSAAVRAEPAVAAEPAPIPESSACAAVGRPMRITFLVRALDYGGAERQLSALARGLHARGHRVVVAVFYPDGPLEQELRDAGVPVHIFNKTGRWDLTGFMTRLLRFLRQERPDILHGYLDTPNLIGLGARFFVPVKVVAGVRSSNTPGRQRDWLGHLHHHAEQRLIRFADLVVVNSRAGLRSFEPTRLRADRAMVIPNGIDAERFRPDPEAGCQVRQELGIDGQKKVVGLVARLDPVKDHETFLRSAALLGRERDDVRFLCVGSGDERYEDSLHKLSEELGLADCLIWAGSRADMPAVYNALDVAVLCSVAEGFPNVLGEAMACGIPCVTTDVGDAAWIVGDTGRVVPTRDPEALRDAIAEVLDVCEKSPSTTQALRSRIVAGFSLVALIDSTEWALCQLLGMP